MSLIITICLLICLSAITYQDLKDKEFNIIWIPLLLITGIGGALYNRSFLWEYLGLNVLFVLLLFFSCASYVVLRKRVSFRQFFDNYFGIGDLLFWLALTPLLPPFEFICLLTLSFMVAFFLTLILSQIFKKQYFIPLAGYQSIFFFTFIIYIELIVQQSLFTFQINFFQ